MQGDNETPTMYASAEEAVDATPPSPDEKFDQEKLLRYRGNFDEDTAKMVLTDLLHVHPHEVELIIKLRVIYYPNQHRRRGRKKVPIQIVLIISKIEWIVAYAKGIIQGKDLEEFERFIRRQWKLVGDYINSKFVVFG